MFFGKNPISWEQFHTYVPLDLSTLHPDCHILSPGHRHLLPGLVQQPLRKAFFYSCLPIICCPYNCQSDSDHIFRSYIFLTSNLWWSPNDYGIQVKLLTTAYKQRQSWTAYQRENTWGKNTGQMINLWVHLLQLP